MPIADEFFTFSGACCVAVLGSHLGLFDILSIFFLLFSSSDSESSSPSLSGIYL